MNFTESSSEAYCLIFKAKSALIRNEGEFSIKKELNPIQIAGGLSF